MGTLGASMHIHGKQPTKRAQRTLPLSLSLSSLSPFPLPLSLSRSPAPSQEHATR